VLDSWLVGFLFPIFACCVFSECSSATSSKTVEWRLLLSASFLPPERIKCFREFSEALDLGPYIDEITSTLSEIESSYVFYVNIPPRLVSTLETFEGLDYY